MNVAAARSHGRAHLTSAGVPDPQLDADHLLAHVVGLPRLHLVMQPDRPLDRDQAAAFASLLARRANREPLQYLLGSWSFHHLELAVGPGALVPRPETEELVGHVLADLLGNQTAAPDRPRRPGPGRSRIVDVGAGTGAIGLALARAVPDATVVLVEPCPTAAGWADRNRRDLRLTDRTDLVRARGTAAIATASVDVLVSNPPYIATAELAELMPEVAWFEPRLALDGGPDGLDVIRDLLADAARVLAPGGRLFFEHGHGQRAAIRQLPAPGLTAPATFNDAQGRERFFVFTRHAA